MPIKRLSRVSMFILAIGSSLAVAGAANAASGAGVTVVVPVHAKAPQTFQFTVKGTFKTNQLTGPAPKKAFLIVLRQPVADACRSNERDDWLHISASLRTFVGTEAKSPFGQKVTWSHYTYRRVCAYLFSKPFSQLGKPGTSKQLARGSATVPL